MASAQIATAQSIFGPTYVLEENLTSSCFYNEDGEFVYIGDISSKGFKCIRDTYKLGTKTIRINSHGGSAATGLAIANYLKEEHFHLFIDERCISACAIYILPLADKLSVTLGSGVILHGGPSHYQSTSQDYKADAINSLIKAGYDEEAAKQEFESSLAFTDKLIEAGDKLKATHNIGDGWFMEAGGWSDTGDGEIVSVAAEEWLEAHQTPALIVDRKFIESCLPDVEIVEFHGPYDEKSLKHPGFKERLDASGLVARPDAICVPELKK